MHSISAVLIARNEERNIRHCLQTIAWCDEIVVVDMESEDKTVSIAREYTDKIYSHPNIPAFDIAKKFAVEKSVGDWILLVDADEMISRSLASVLSQIAARDDVDVVEIPFKHYIMGEWVRNTGWGYSPKPRFFRKQNMELTGIIHNYMNVRSGSVVIQLPPSDDNCINHFCYIDSRHFVEKLNKYTSVEARQLFDQKKRYSTFALIRRSIREFVVRFLVRKGYKEGVRGFALSLMMSFYRALTYIKLWEQYEFAGESVQSKYSKIKENIMKDWENGMP